MLKPQVAPFSRGDLDVFYLFPYFHHWRRCKVCDSLWVSNVTMAASCTFSLFCFFQVSTWPFKVLKALLWKRRPTYNKVLDWCMRTDYRFWVYYLEKCFNWLSAGFCVAGDAVLAHTDESVSQWRWEEVFSPILGERKLRVKETVAKWCWPEKNGQSLDLNLYYLIPNPVLFIRHRSCLSPPWELQKIVECGEDRVGKAPSSLGYRGARWWSVASFQNWIPGPNPAVHRVKGRDGLWNQGVQSMLHSSAIY